MVYIYIYIKYTVGLEKHNHPDTLPDTPPAGGIKPLTAGCGAAAPLGFGAGPGSKRLGTYLTATFQLLIYQRATGRISEERGGLCASSPTRRDSCEASRSEPQRLQG